MHQNHFLLLKKLNNTESAQLWSVEQHEVQQQLQQLAGVTTMATAKFWRQNLGGNGKLFSAATWNGPLNISGAVEPISRLDSDGAIFDLSC